MSAIAVFGLLLCYRALLSAYMRRRLATLLAPGILYTVGWNYLVLNRLYLPFDTPALFFMVAGWLAIQRHRWVLYYFILALGTLNRETTWILPVVFGLVGLRRMPWRSLALHLTAQTVLWFGIKLALYHVIANPEHRMFLTPALLNLQTWRGMLTLQGSGPKDAAKLLLIFGSLWLALPFVMRGQPEFVRRSLWAAVPFAIAIFFVGLSDEVRVYAELVPLVTTPVLIAVARWVDEAGAAPPPVNQPGHS